MLDQEPPVGSPGALGPRVTPQEPPAHSHCESPVSAQCIFMGRRHVVIREGLLHLSSALAWPPANMRRTGGGEREPLLGTEEPWSRAGGLNARTPTASPKAPGSFPPLLGQTVPLLVREPGKTLPSCTHTHAHVCACVCEPARPGLGWLQGWGLEGLTLGVPRPPVKGRCSPSTCDPSESRPA